MTLLLLTKEPKIDSAPKDSSNSSPQIASQSPDLDGSPSISNDVARLFGTTWGVTHSYREVKRTKRRRLGLGANLWSQPVGSQNPRRSQDTGIVRTNILVSDAINAKL